MEDEVKFEPFTLSVKPAPPAVADVGEMLVIAGGMSPAADEIVKFNENNAIAELFQNTWTAQVPGYEAAAAPAIFMLSVTQPSAKEILNLVASIDHTIGPDETGFRGGAYCHAAIAEVKPS
jgi:hypothetical protein